MVLVCNKGRNYIKCVRCSSDEQREGSKTSFIVPNLIEGFQTRECCVLCKVNEIESESLTLKRNSW